MPSNNIVRISVWLLNKGDYFERGSKYLGEKEGLEPRLENGSEGQILVRGKEGFFNSQRWPTMAGTALGMTSFPLLEVCKQGYGIT